MNKKSTLVLLTYDEIDGLRALFDKIPFDRVEEVLAVDGGSTDGSVEFLKERGIEVIPQEVKGRGEAFRIAVNVAAGEQIVFFSPDGNEDPGDIPRLLDLLEAGADMAIASRFMEGARNEEDDLLFPWRKWANRGFTRLANLIWGGEITDTINGYRAVTKNAFRKLEADAQGYAIEYQMSIRAMKLGLKVAEIPTREGNRIGGESKSKSIPTGLIFLRLLLREILRGRKWGNFFRSFKSDQYLFYKIVFFLASLYVLLIVLDYDMNWVQAEVVHRDLPSALKDGAGLNWKDLVKAFDYQSFDAAPRCRFISYFFQNLDIKLRNGLFHYISPHPSLSLTWIFSLILSPFLLFKLISNLTDNRIASWAGISLYFLTTGFLSGVTLLFHAGKPLTNFLAIFCLYCASRIVLAAREREYFSRKVFRSSLLLPVELLRSATREKGAGVAPGGSFRDRILKAKSYEREVKYFSKRIAIWYGLLFVSLFLSFFTDETAWFIFIAVPIIFPDIFKPRRNRTLVILGYISVFVSFLLFLTLIAPAITNYFGFGKFDFWQWSFEIHDKPGAKVWEEFKISNVLYNARNFIFSQFVPGRTVLTDGIREKAKFVYPPLIAYFFLLFIVMSRKGKKIFLRTLIALVLFLFFQSAIHAKHVPRLPSSHYYGALFAVFLTLPLVALLGERKNPYRIINKVILLFLLLVFGYNFFPINRLECYGIVGFYMELFPGETVRMKKGTPLTFPMVRQAWNKRGDREALLKMKPQYPKRSYWLFRELEYVEVPPGKLPSGESAVREKKDLLCGRRPVLTASSHNQDGESVINLIDGTFAYWHVSEAEKDRPAWVVVDFGRGNETVVGKLAARPRKRTPNQFFRTAELLGSNDGKKWEKIADIKQQKEPADDGWQEWDFENDRAFRYYKFYIIDGHAGKEHCFMSMSNLAMYEGER